MKNFCYRSIFGCLLFNLVTLSTSICVFENGTYCEDSSVLLVSHSDVKEKGYSILVEQLCILGYWYNCKPDCCSDNYFYSVIVAKIQETDLDSRMIDDGLAEVCIYMIRH